MEIMLLFGVTTLPYTPRRVWKKMINDIEIFSEKHFYILINPICQIIIHIYEYSPWIVCDADVIPFKLFNVNMYAKIMSNINVGSSIFIRVVAAILLLLFLLEALVE